MDWDYIIVGGGTTGCVLANRLSANSQHKVLLLEAGGKNNSLLIKIPTAQGNALEKPQYTWQYQLEADETRHGKKEIWPTGKGLGGGSAINGMLFIQGLPEDYDHWASLGNQGWGYKDILPYEKKVRDMVLGEGAGKLRYQHPLVTAFINTSCMLGFDAKIRSVSQKNGRRNSSASAYLDPIKHRKNLTVLTNVVVTRLLLKNNVAIGVEYREQRTIKQAFCNKEVILSASTLANPKILMLSGIGPREELKKHGIPVIHELKGVGKNLQEHPAFLLSYLTNVPTIRSELMITKLLYNLSRWFFKGNGPLTTPVAQGIALINTNFTSTSPTVFLEFTALEFKLANQSTVEKPAPTVMFAPILCRPEARGYVSLASNNPLDMPKIHYQFFSSENDVKNLVDALKITRKICSTSPLSSYLIKEKTPGLNIQTNEEMINYIKETGVRSFHNAGSCRMGNDELAVVDDKLRVHGIKNLRIADCSIMPTIVSVNPMVTTLTIGEKCADLILAQTA